MPPLKKGDVRQAIDKRIESARRAQVKLTKQSTLLDPSVNLKKAEQKGRESALQSVRNELFGERLPKAAKAAKKS